MKRTQLPPLRDKRHSARAKDRLPPVGGRVHLALYFPGRIEKIGAAVFAALLPKTERLLEKYLDRQ